MLGEGTAKRRKEGHTKKRSGPFRGQRRDISEYCAARAFGGVTPKERLKTSALSPNKGSKNFGDICP